MAEHSVPTCPICGSKHVLFDAYAFWNPETQGYELDYVSDRADCEDCGSSGFTPNWSRN